MEDKEEGSDCLDFSFARSRLGSEVDFDDELAVPESIKIIDVDGSPVAIEHSDEEANGTCLNLY